MADKESSPLGAEEGGEAQKRAEMADQRGETHPKQVEQQSVGEGGQGSAEGSASMQLQGPGFASAPANPQVVLPPGQGYLGQQQAALLPHQGQQGFGVSTGGYPYQSFPMPPQPPGPLYHNVPPASQAAANIGQPPALQMSVGAFGGATVRIESPAAAGGLVAGGLVAGASVAAAFAASKVAESAAGVVGAGLAAGVATGVTTLAGFYLGNRQQTEEAIRRVVERERHIRVENIEEGSLLVHVKFLTLAGYWVLRSFNEKIDKRSDRTCLQLLLEDELQGIGWTGPIQVGLEGWWFADEEGQEEEEAAGKEQDERWEWAGREKLLQERLAARREAKRQAAEAKKEEEEEEQKRKKSEKEALPSGFSMQREKTVINVDLSKEKQDEILESLRSDKEKLERKLQRDKERASIQVQAKLEQRRKMRVSAAQEVFSLGERQKTILEKTQHDPEDRRLQLTKVREYLDKVKYEHTMTIKARQQASQAKFEETLNPQEAQAMSRDEKMNRAAEEMMRKFRTDEAGVKKGVKSSVPPSVTTEDSGLPEDVSSVAAMSITSAGGVEEGPLKQWRARLQKHKDSQTAQRLIKVYRSWEEGAELLTSSGYTDLGGVKALVQGFMLDDIETPDITSALLYGQAWLNLNKAQLIMMTSQLQADPTDSTCLLLTALQLPHGDSRVQTLQQVVDAILQHGPGDWLYQHLHHIYCYLGIAIWSASPRPKSTTSQGTDQPRADLDALVKALSAMASSLMYKQDHLNTVYITALLSKEVSETEAIRQLEHFLRLAPECYGFVSDAHYDLATLYNQQQDRQKVIHHFTRGQQTEANMLPVFFEVHRSIKDPATKAYKQVRAKKQANK